MAPRKTTTKRRYKRRTKKQYRRRYRGRRKAALVVPVSKSFKLKCVSTWNVTSSVTPANAKVLNCTSIYDVDPDLGGPSIGGYTAWAAFYKRYRVLGIKYRLVAYNSEQVPVMLSAQFIPAQSSDVPGEGTAMDYPEVAMENSNTRSAFLPPSTNGTPRTLSAFGRVKNIWGTREAVTSPEWAANFGSSPLANVYLRVAVTRLDGGALTQGVRFSILQTFYGKFDQKKLEFNN